MPPHSSISRTNLHALSYGKDKSVSEYGGQPQCYVLKVKSSNKIQALHPFFGNTDESGKIFVKSQTNEKYVTYLPSTFNFLMFQVTSCLNIKSRVGLVKFFENYVTFLLIPINNKSVETFAVKYITILDMIYMTCVLYVRLSFIFP